MPEKDQPKKNILFIINPKSGRKRKEDIPGLINKGIDKDQFEVKVSFTEFSGHAVELAKEAVDNKTDIVVAVGGDGTINEVASVVIHSETILAILPTGSGNGLARHLGIPLSIPKALKLINETHSQTIDTASVNGIPFVSIAGVGFDALVAKQFADSNKRGFLTYFRIVANNYLNYKPKKYIIQFNSGLTIKTRALFIAFANSNQFGYNTTIAPNAKLNDGLLDVCIVQKPPLFEVPIIANLLLLRRIDLSSFVQIIPARELTLRRKKNRRVNIDGEPMKIKNKLCIKINPLSLKVIIPKNGKK